ncbi:MAG: ATP-dependent helicase [Candidatus Woesearchaeota archaeon]
MIEKKEKPNSAAEIERILNPLVKEWFYSRFKSFSKPQLFGVMEVHSRNNMLLSAPTGATKCLTPDETVLITKNGMAKLVSGYELMEEAKNGKLLKTVGKTGKLSEVSGLKSFSLENNNNNIHPAKALVYSEPVKDNMLKIKTEYGREVKVSKEHPLLVEDKGWVKAGDLKVGDRIAAPKKIILPEKEVELDWNKALDVVRAKAELCLAHDDFLRLRKRTGAFKEFSGITSEETRELLLLAGISYTAAAKETGLSLSQIHSLVHRKSDYGRNCFEQELRRRLFGVRFEENKLVYKTYGSHSFSFTYPKFLDIKLARWLAFVLAEGLIGDYKLGTHLMVSQKSQKGLLREFLQVSKDYFGVNFLKKNEKDYVVYSTLFCYFICALFSIKRGRGRYVEFPQWLLNCKQDVKSNFLGVFFSLEASFTGREIRIYQANKQKIEVINYILMSHGIFSSIGKQMSCATNTKDKIMREYYTLTIRQIENLKRFISAVPIEHKNKFRILKHIRTKPSGNFVGKFAFDYRKIRVLSRHYRNDRHFSKKLGQIYEVVRRTGFITCHALSKLADEIMRVSPRDLLLKEIDTLLKLPIVWFKVKSIEEFEYKGEVFDLTVPDLHNFIGGYGGIVLHNTLTTFMSILNELVDSAEKEILQDKIYCLYISPLKALNEDIAVNLLEPLKEIEKIAGKKLGIRVGVRTGDTTPSQKSAMLKKPPHILITTPESLAIVLSSIKFKDHLRNVEWCILDEVHAMADSKRGVHLSLSIERLQCLSPGMSRTGLSATIAPLEEVAKFVVGGERRCKIVDVQFIKQMDLKVLSPVPDLINITYDGLNKRMYELIDELIKQHKTTLIFTNTRSGTERVVHNLKIKFPKNYYEIHEGPPTRVASLIGAHHGSLSKDHRFRIESALREGKLKAVVCSTSLELGIDIGYIDLVILLGSPKSVARALQRIGRSGHQLHATTKGRLIVLDRDDLVECSVLLKQAIEKKIDKVQIPKNCLDVLAQQVFGMALEHVWDARELFNTVKKSYCYSSLGWKDFEEVVSYLAGEFTSLEDRHIYARIWYDRDEGKIGKKGKMSRVIYMTNIGTIPDQQGVLVKIMDYKIGTIDEAFLERLKPGDRFVLGGDVYQFRFSRGMVAQVRSASGTKPNVPSWISESLPLSFDLANAIQHFRYLVNDKLKHNHNKEEIISFIHSSLYVDENAAEAIFGYLKEQFDYEGMPNEREIYVEHYTDEEGKKNVVFHTLYGRRVNDALSRALAYAVARSQKRDVEIGITDNGFMLSYRKDVNVMRAFSLLKSKDFRAVLKLGIENSEVLKRRFRHCAARALMILRQYKGRTKRVGRQQVSSQILINAVRRISDDFFVLKEARREVMEDQMDVGNAIRVLEAVESGKIKLKEIHTTIPTPFAFNIVLRGYSDILKMEDKADFLRRMHRNVLAKISLKQGKKKKVLEARKFSYPQEWKRGEEEERLKKEERLFRLRTMVANLSDVAFPVKEALMKIIDHEEVSGDALKELRKADTKKWPKEVRKVAKKVL